MSAIGTKRTFGCCEPMSAFGGKADIGALSARWGRTQKAKASQANLICFWFLAARLLLLVPPCGRTRQRVGAFECGLSDRDMTEPYCGTLQRGFGIFD